MTRDDAIAALKALEPEARALGVTGLYLFGSTARDEAGPESDVDLYIDYDPQRMRGLAVLGAKHLIEDHTGFKIDFGTRGGLHPALREEIEKSAIRVF